MTLSNSRIGAPVAVSLPGLRAPAVGFEAPFEMLQACHERVERMLRLLARLRTHLAAHGPDHDAREAAHDVMRYFDQAAPHHHDDEERHVFPLLLRGEDDALKAVVRRLQQDHRDMANHWSRARVILQALQHAPTDGWTGLSTEEDAALDRFAGLYARHIEDEEQQVYPAAQRLLGAAGLQAMGEDMTRRRIGPLSPPTNPLPG